MVSRVSAWSCKQLEASLLPTQEKGCAKVTCYVLQSLKFCVMLPVASVSSLLAFVMTGRVTYTPPLIDFAKHPQWSEKGVKAAPVDIGFATADFQDNGPACHPHTNWGEVYKKKDRQGEVPDLWNHPERAVARLKELGVKKYRFSVSRDKIEPRHGHIDHEALKHYRDLCRLLKKHDIEPMVTLHHFTDPTYFSWEDPEEIESFVYYAQMVTKMLYKEGVRQIITINEPTVVAFQGWVMGEFPPHRTRDFEGAGRVLENMLRTHVAVYQALKRAYPDLEIGISHDPIRFRHYHKWHPLWSPIERILCHYLTEVNHSAFMRFLQTGDFSLKVPFRTNYRFTLREPPPMDFIGVQYYTDPLIKISWTGGESVTREAGEKITAYQYRTYPQGLASVLEECKTLRVPVELTEIGIDTGINKDLSDAERIRYFDRIFQVVQKALAHGVKVRSLYFWTLIDNLEWYKEWSIRMGFYSFDPKTGRIDPRLAALWLQRMIVSRRVV